MLNQDSQAVAPSAAQAKRLSLAETVALGNSYFEKGALDTAEQIFRNLLKIAPGHAQCLHGLGLIAHRKGRDTEALPLLRQAIELAPQVAEFHNNLGAVLQDLGEFATAVACHRRALALAPAMAGAQRNLGVALEALGQRDEALTAFTEAVRADPGYAEAYNNLGVLLKDQGRLTEAETAFRTLLDLTPDHAEGHANLSATLSELGRTEEAMVAAERALALRPDFPQALNGVGMVHLSQGKVEAAIAAFRRVLALQPDFAAAHNNLGQMLLLSGRFEEGWPEYEWRWQLRSFTRRHRQLPLPVWDGGSLAGRTILLRAEQGLGDTLQFVRYAPLVAACGARVILEAPPRLVWLLGRVAGVSAVISSKDPPPDADCQAALLSLPGLLGTRLETIPAAVPYLPSDPEKVAAWSARLGDASRLKVGLCWQGNPRHKGDRLRSCPLAALLPLAEVPGVRLISLQQGVGSEQLAALPDPTPIEELGPDYDSGPEAFRDSVSLLQALDLVISVDTSIAHLAGGLARPLWLMLSTAPDWRWLMDREDSPWYPSVRLYRQALRGDWEPVVARLREDLAKRAAR